MSRPVSVEQLLGTDNQGGQLAKPKFLSKKQRDNRPSKDLNRHSNGIRPRPSKHRFDEEEEEEVEEVDEPTFVSRSTLSVNKPLKKLKSSKFNFDWDTTEDTTLEFQPLVNYPTLHNEERTVPQGAHWSEKLLEEMTVRDWRIFRDDFNITAKGTDLQNPLRSWKESKLQPQLVNIIEKLNFTEPTPIQRAAIPIAIEHRDIVGIAETGSGKTLAFLIPLLNYILSIDDDYLKYEHPRGQNHNQPLGLILAPTRELALQITKEAKKFTDLLNLVVISIIGGHQYEETINSVKNGVHIVVATPGRLIDSLERGIINLDKCYFLTMDEADKMIDMGFEKSLQSILSYLPTEETLQRSLDQNILHVTKRTTLMFTATITPAIEKITKGYLIDPGHLTIGDPNELLENIVQRFEYLGDTASETAANEQLDAKRFGKLLLEVKNHIRYHENYSIIIFANYKRVCELISQQLADKGLGENVVIHGSKSQELREAAVESFRAHKVNILIATDVAARGIDVPNVSLVINYQMPMKFEEYIHRIGRTGRAGKSGTSYSMVDVSDKEIFIPLKKFLTRGGRRIPEWLFRYVETIKD